MNTKHQQVMGLLYHTEVRRAICQRVMGPQLSLGRLHHLHSAQYHAPLLLPCLMMTHAVVWVCTLAAARRMGGDGGSGNTGPTCRQRRCFEVKGSISAPITCRSGPRADKRTRPTRVSRYRTHRTTLQAANKQARGPLVSLTCQVEWWRDAASSPI
ncbi:hypothetical protein E2C01_042505 [Portunus trituberculatus]|uniref:Uncharacterized protein n=1 Tax=Portunus trituberculatus TaxID=210409 RepID=A0A5B7FUU9_PORTR|nr:hypothetical protein [Portunus trituberculatus]